MQGIARGAYDVLLFMTAVQVIHLFQVAERMQCVAAMRAGLHSMAIISIGPTTTEELTHYGISPDFEPSRPKMSFIVNEAAQYAGKVLEQKRGGEALRSTASADTESTEHLNITSDCAMPGQTSRATHCAFYAHHGRVPRWADAD